jgi:hypothetical protein
MRLGGRALVPAVIASVISAALLLSLSSVALAGQTAVVPPKGKVAGDGYAYWLARSWQASLSVSAPVNPCQTLTANARRVALLTLKTDAPGTDAYTCSEPAGRPIYVDELSDECSTFKGDHIGFGRTDADLKRCARTGFRGGRETTTIDGHGVDVSKLVAASPAYSIRVPKNNILGLPQGNGRSAAYGHGLLLLDASKGTHIIHTIARAGPARWDVTFTVHVR